MEKVFFLIAEQIKRIKQIESFRSDSVGYNLKCVDTF